MQEFLTVREQYQAAIDKLEHLALATKDPLTNTAGGTHFCIVDSKMYNI